MMVDKQYIIHDHYPALYIYTMHVQCVCVLSIVNTIPFVEHLITAGVIKLIFTPTSGDQ